MKRTLIAVAAIGLMGAAAPPPFRIAVIAAASAACAPVPASAPAGEKAYFDLLTKRLGRSTVACPVASAAEGAAALVSGKLDMAPLDPASYAAVHAQARATMTVRPADGLTRVPVVLAVRAGKPGDAAALKGRTVAFGAQSPAGVDLPRLVLAQQGYGPDVLKELVTGDETTAIAALRSGKADAVALQSGAWQRQCRGTSPTDHPCADLKVVWTARPEADKALAVRRDMAEPERYRLIGVHMAMHLEDKPAFAWSAAQLAASGAGDYEPAEAEALSTARMQ